MDAGAARAAHSAHALSSLTQGVPALPQAPTRATQGCKVGCGLLDKLPDPRARRSGLACAGSSQGSGFFIEIAPSSLLGEAGGQGLPTPGA